MDKYGQTKVNFFYKMDKQEFLNKITTKKEFSDLPEGDVEKVFEIFKRRQTSDEDKVKLSRDMLRKVYSVFSSRKVLNKNILDKKSPEEILKKHISTRERFDFYSELYEKLLKNFSKEVSILDMGAGINGLSYDFFPKNKKINYFGIEAVGQLVDLMNYYFEKNKIKKGNAVRESLFEIEKIKRLIKDSKNPKIVFLFKVIDSLEMIERNYSKKFLLEIVPLIDFAVVSFATKSLVSKKKFKVRRFWFENFVKENFNLYDNFILGGERYFVFGKAKKFVREEINL